MTFRTCLRAGACAVALTSLTAFAAMASQPPSSPAERAQTAQLNEQQLSGAGMPDNANSNGMAAPASDMDNGTMRHRHHHHHAQSTSDRVDRTPGSAKTDMMHDNNLPTNADGDLGNGPTDGGPRNNPGTPQPQDTSQTPH
jgi:hypothetical protein